MQYENCIECPNHIVVADPDPSDWFCYDDVAVLCKKLANSNPGHPANARFDNKPVTVACRPHHTVKETTPPPDWCPLRGKTDD